jgi:alpha-amylase/alpha-mannosidase (GH57 family)
VDDTPGARVVFNLVPSLLDQLAEYAAGTARDRFLELGMKPAAELSDDERLFIIDNFFAANRQRLIDPNPRYRELFHLAGSGREGDRDRLRRFGRQEIIDLQLWFFLAWTGEEARRVYPEAQDLAVRGRNFTEDDKILLFGLHRAILNQIVPLYRRLAEEGKAELSVSPHFHPILPLLCDSRIATVAMPRTPLPDQPFRYPGDARGQILSATNSFQQLMGHKPAGMWPSEGSVSDEALSLMADAGLSWGATDEGVLARSLPGGLGDHKARLYHPYAFHQGGHELSLLFRDHQLSDLIGFTYSQWEPERAAHDFISRLREIRRRHPDASVVPVILDGENAWEYYSDNGSPFLRTLYHLLVHEQGMELVTCSEYLATNPSRTPLAHVHPGSWINADYGIWIGHPEENRAWDLLAKARSAAVSHIPELADLLASGDLSTADERSRQVAQTLQAAEGSDWFWWYGDDHFSPHSDRFDALFRRHLMNVYRLLRLDIPPELQEPIKKKGPAGLVREPAALITPQINGRVDNYFEWLAAGLYDLTRQSSTMHASENLLQSFFFGFDRDTLYFRLDGATPLDRTLQSGDELALHLICDNEFRLVMGIAAGSSRLMVRDGQWRDAEWECHWQIGAICEIAIPLAAVAALPGRQIFAYVTLRRNGEEVGRWPTDSPLIITYRGEELELDNWLI